MPVLPLLSTELAVWTTRTPVADHEHAAAIDLLADDERERLAAISHPRSRSDYVIGRALIRRTLSRYVALPASSWRFVIDSHGRPELVPGQTALDLRFNLAHTEGLVVCAVTLGRRIGIDVEAHDAAAPALELARRFLAPAEADDVACRTDTARVERFYRYWTVREAYVKAHGLGLTMPLGGISFSYGDGGDIRIEGEPVAARRWRFWQWNPSPSHTLALAAELDADEIATLVVDDVIAFGGLSYDNP